MGRKYDITGFNVKNSATEHRCELPEHTLFSMDDFPRVPPVHFRKPPYVKKDRLNLSHCWVPSTLLGALKAPNF